MATTPTLASFVDSTGSLGNGATFNSPARDMHVGAANAAGVSPSRYASSVVVSATPAQACTVNVQVSADWGSAVPTWGTIDTSAVSAGQNFSKEVKVPYRWVRVQVVNGATTQVVSLTTAFQE